ncbi:PTS system N-acetylglucosamine-specific IIA component (Glc family) /PTS system N-acetylglucosamine-specific IIB component (Glc family) /PTS system N-acetylglucosamine-specific IIC component (Glc family) [Labedella gwakjiensis]|uniref:PTS sucrose transporter subunit IIBC n=1 Tax=Labedella gwakjiensis TaxID=390269 RepID=A0A2P8GR59_9MICO|nr:N-acetylglucosamine-specific PTS transporter subunit IIBC [Labedella gwakjiensis]PSL36450.1 PTS system N-acetylglucosamine-specific IIA component (Glc family) /PTS system N-acetylglucosamine-specific IIB component (Glc family) /PTS system N-acetylglucosamine-specific IIC component (Glc family) [Labedella gwakjiensis]RUQ85625.1 PTS sucrose transporter subunit IIBC [Labedella gwakjiensis]
MKFFQKLGRSIMLPVAVLPVAAILSGLGYWIKGATGDDDNVVATFLGTAGGALLDNMALLFAIGISIGMAKKSDGTSALAGLVSWLTITTLLDPAKVAAIQGVAVDDVDPAFSFIKNVFVGIICGLIGAFCYDRFKDTKLPDALSFFSGKRSVAIVTAGVSLVAALVLYVAWPLVFGGLVAFGEWIVTLGPVGAGLYGFFNRLLIPLGLHHALNSVFWFDVAGINDLNNFLAGEGTYGVTGQYMTGFFPVMMFGLPGAALAMYVTAKTTRKKVAAGLLLSGAVSSFFVGVTEPLEFAFMFLAPVLYVIHAVFMGISLAISALLPVRMGFGFSGGFIDLVLQWMNPMAENPWIILVMGVFWFVVYFLVFRFVILRFKLKTPGREDDEPAESTASDGSTDERYRATAARFLDALGGPDNIVELENCATRLRMEVADVSKVDDAALKRAGAAGTMKPGGTSVQVVYGLNVQFVKDAMEGIMSGDVSAPSASTPPAAPSGTTLTAPATSTTVRLRQPVDGTIAPLSSVPDPTFADGIMGPGLAIEPTGDTVIAPADGTIGHVFDTGHAVAVVLDDGTEILVHVGIDTVHMKGDGFTTLVETGQRVVAGTPLLRFDLDKIRAAGHASVTPVIVLNNEHATIEFD